MECAGVFLISAEGALFGPSKYGLLPELLPEPRLSWGNGIIELGTFVAGIGATMAAGFLAERYAGREAVAGFSAAGLHLRRTRHEPRNFARSRRQSHEKFRWNPLGDFGAQLKIIGADRVLGWAVLGNTYLFFLAALLQFTIVIYGHDVLHVDDAHISYLQAAVAIGIGLGSFAAGYLSGGKIEYGLIPLGAVGMTVFGALLYCPGHSLTVAGTHLALLGFFGGFFAVPLGALIQHRPRPEQKGGVIAAANLLSFVGIVLAAGAYYLFANVFHQTPAGIFLDGAILTLVTTAYSIYLLPDSLVRFVLWMATHSLYRMRVEGRENIPERGGALFVSNHMSFVDALLLIASIDRPIRFLMFKGIYDLPYVKPFAKLIRAIPISSELRPREMLQSLREATDAIRAGEVVCIFAEGQITRIGQMLPFRRGMERIMKGVDAPIVPVNLDGVWGSIFSFERGRFLWKMPRSIPYPVTISFGKPMPPTATPFEVRDAVQALQTEAYVHRKNRLRTLHRSLIRTAHRSPFRFAMGDKRRPRMKWGGVLLSAIFLARRLRGTWAGQEMVGILLPPSVPGALVNFAAMLAGKIPVNLNYTMSDEALASCAAQCKLETVITTKALLDSIPLKVPGKTILLEEAAAGSQPRRKNRRARALVSAGRVDRARGQRRQETNARRSRHRYFFERQHRRAQGRDAHALQHRLQHRADGADVHVRQQDCLLGVLPFFHSFGFTVTLWLPAVLGVASCIIRARSISRRSANSCATIASRSCWPRRRSCRRTCAAARPKISAACDSWWSARRNCRSALAVAFEDRFGIRPLEGYGATECSPVVAVNTRDFRAPGFRQVGAKRGRIGHPLPGISVRIVDPDTREPVAAGAAGLLLVRGPNVMKGYLGKPEKTAEVLRDGWYVTGDIAAEDEDGFLTITDRLSRFSKIGGEMVPHIKIEEQLHELAGATEQKFVVTGVPDGKKGERLVVLHTLPPGGIEAVTREIAADGLAESLDSRARTNSSMVEELPHLGTGKLDLRRIRELALEFSPGEKEQ